MALSDSLIKDRYAEAAWNRAFYRDIRRKVVVIRPVAVGGMVLHRHVE